MFAWDRIGMLNAHVGSSQSCRDSPKHHSFFIITPFNGGQSVISPELRRIT